MRMTFVDDSFPYDGASPGRQPLGGVERGVAGLAAALAARGHEVTVFNRCEAAAEIDGVRWLPWETPRPPDTGVLIALRRPALLAEIEATSHVVWMAGPARPLAPDDRRCLERFRPTLLFRGEAHRRSWHQEGVASTVVENGVGEAFGPQPDSEPFDPPRVVVTTHPRAGLAGLLEMWIENVHPACPEASLHIHSAALWRGKAGGAVADDIRPLFLRATAAEAQGVVIERPGTEAEMAAAYRAAHIHLYPRVADGSDCSTLAESQACGLPAVAVACDAVRECVVDGETGFVVPDRAALINVALQILNEPAVFARLRGEALRRIPRRWADAAAELETRLP